MDLEQIRFSPRQAIDEVSELFHFLATSKGIGLVTLVDSTLPSHLLGDPSRLKQILTNLINNALKFTSEGEVGITVECLPQEDQVQPIRFKITDTGIGMDPQVVERLFKPFEQADNSISRTHGGTGLGLHISKRLCEMMDGEIGVSSKPGEGSEFWFIVRLQVPTPPKQGVGTRDLSMARVLCHHPDPAGLHHEMDQLRTIGCMAGKVSSTDLVEEGLDALPDLIMIHASCLEEALPFLEIYRSRHPKSRFAYLSQEGQRGEAKLAWEKGFGAYLTGVMEVGVLRLVLEKLLSEEPSQIITRFSSTEQTSVDVSVLVCEDNAINQKLVTRILEKLGYHVDLADNGVKGLASARSKAYDLILMDLRIPEMDGLEATKEIRAKSKNEATPIIALTEDAVLGMREECMAIGMNAFLAKPYTKEQLLATLKEIRGES